jgi:hypothetical protein
VQVVVSKTQGRSPVSIFKVSSYPSYVSIKLPIGLVLLFVIVALAIPSRASTVTGRIVDKSTNQSVSGDEVILFSLQDTMKEEARTTTDSEGKFKFERAADGPFVIGVYHQKIAYHSQVSSGSASIELPVYDAVSSLQQLKQTDDVLFLEGDRTKLTVRELFSMENQSAPPRTLVGSNTFDFQLPAGAQLESTAVQAPNGLPQAIRVVGRSMGRYEFDYPLRPGVTKFEAVYHLPNAGQISIVPGLLRPASRVGVIIPASMDFVARHPSTYTEQQHDGSAIVRTGHYSGNRSLFAFSVAGFGTINADIPKSSLAKDSFAGAKAIAIAASPQSARKVQNGISKSRLALLPLAVGGLLFIVLLIFGFLKKPNQGKPFAIG